MIRTLAYTVMAVVTVTASPTADVVINEVLANEPGGAQTLEWTELYNDSPATANLAFYELRVFSGTDSTSFLLDGDISPGGYLLFCRDSVRFEEHFGDSSGIWGDDPAEDFPVRQLSFQLTNAGGRVALFRLLSLQSELAWDEAGDDGCSWERFHPLSDEIAPSVDAAGSTPGRINSRTPLPVDLALASVTPSVQENSTILAFEIANRGLSVVSDATLELHYFDGAASDSLGQLIAAEPVGEVDSGIVVILVGQYQLFGYYQSLIARVDLAGDDRPGNNRLVFTAPGADYPPVILSEFLANPISTFGSEWVELKNISDTTIDLVGWQLGDSIGLADIATSELLLFPDEYLVLADDSAGFSLDYPNFPGNLHQPPAWRELNNGSDSVRLIDVFGVQADCVYYDHAFDGAHTWSRAGSGEREGEWGRSEDAGGTPGEANRVRFAPAGTQTLAITITPRIISPDGDGLDDSAVIVVTVSDAPAYTLRLYDSDGRPVRTFEDGAVDLTEQYVWRGENDSGQKQPIGIYVLYFEATGVESLKKTIVVAR